MRDDVFERRQIDIDGVPGLPAVEPNTEEELAAILASANEASQVVVIWGGGTHRSLGRPVEAPDLIVSTGGLVGVSEWEPADLTVVVRSGTPIADLEAILNEAGQTAVLSESPGTGTVGGAVATATSGYRRLRYGPIRDRVLGLKAITADGRLIKGGGRVVKNVAGYDVPRLYTGSMGSLGVITEVCLKLWPLPEATATVELPQPDMLGSVYRPLAVVETHDRMLAYLGGTRAQVSSQVARLGGDATEGLHFPEVPAGEVVWSLRVRPRLLPRFLKSIPASSQFVAQLPVGEAMFGSDSDWDVGPLRKTAEAAGGAVVRVRGESGVDPWGTPPPTLDLQRKLISHFDPGRILEPGRLPGGL